MSKYKMTIPQMERIKRILASVWEEAGLEDSPADQKELKKAIVLSYRTTDIAAILNESVEEPGPETEITDTP